MAEQTAALDLLRDAIETVTVNPDGNEEALAHRLAAYLEERGIAASLQRFAPGRANLLARLPGRGRGAALLLNGHLDTVPFGDEAVWKTPPGKATLQNGVLYGRGVSDMKSGLCAALYAFAALAQEGFVPQNDILFLGTADEESQGLGAQAAVDAGVLEGVGGIVIGEPTGNRISLASKGTLWLEFSVRGKTSHGAYPWEGVNAAELACGLAAEFKDLSGKAAHPYLTPPTCTLTKISGGVKVNMVPDACTFSLDIRTIPGTSHRELLRRVEQTVAAREAAHPGAKITFRVLTDRSPIETEQDAPLVQALADSVRAVTQNEPGYCGTGFFSDASIFLRRYSLPTTLFGPGESSEAHKPNEALLLARYYEAVDCYKNFLRRW